MNQPTAQMYRVMTDNLYPYNVYSGQQDASGIVIASQTLGDGIGEHDWQTVRSGESATVGLDPENPKYVYTTFFASFLGEWDRDPQGNYLGGNNMPLRPRDMLKIGQLFADGGRYDGRQLVPEAWIEESWTPRGMSPWNRHRFGYLWWTERWGGETAHFGWGYGGQFIVVVPRLDLVIVATSSLSQGRRGQSRQVRRFIDNWVVPAFGARR